MFQYKPLLARRIMQHWYSLVFDMECYSTVSCAWLERVCTETLCNNKKYILGAIFIQPYSILLNKPVVTTFNIIYWIDIDIGIYTTGPTRAAISTFVFRRMMTDWIAIISHIEFSHSFTSLLMLKNTVE